MKLLNSFFALLHQHKKTLLLIFIVSTGTLLTSNVISIWLSNRHNLTILTIGTIKTIGVEAYWDPNLENITETFDWKTLWPGATKNITLYIRSVSNVKTNLTLNMTNVNPANISEYFNISWNYKETTIYPEETIQVTLFLSISAEKSLVRYLVDNEVTDFSMEIHIIAKE